MRDKDKKRKVDPIKYGGGKVKKERVEEIKKETEGKERTWKEGDRY